MVSTTASLHRALSSPSRVEILRVLHEQGESSLAEICRGVGLHANTAREHLDRLVDARLVARRPEHSGSRGRPRMLYRALDGAAHGSLPEQLWAHLVRLLATGFGLELEDPAHAAREAGRGWTLEVLRSRPEPPEDRPAAERQLETLLALLEELGMRPELDGGPPLTVRVRRCPWSEVVQAREEVVCAVHRGVVEGVLERTEGPLELVEAGRRDPRTGCVLLLAQRGEHVQCDRKTEGARCCATPDPGASMSETTTQQDTEQSTGCGCGGCGCGAKSETEGLTIVSKDA